MLIKAADDKSKRVALLEELQQSPLLNKSQHDWLRDELFRLRRGLQGERDAAHYLESYLRDDPDRVLLHDLRISVDGQVAQIDHLVMTRGMHVYLLETKNFGGNVHINDRGEFSVEYAGERIFGIESPIEQSRRHEGPLRKLFEQLEFNGRLGGAPKIHHCVLVHPKANISRPQNKAYDTSMVIKADQFRSWHEKFQEQKISTVQVFSSLFNMLSASALKEFAEKLASQHRPANQLELPDFMKPAKPAEPQPHPVAQRAQDRAPVRMPPAKQPSPPAERKRLVCATCGEKITYSEGKFCWNNEKRFGGQQYCRQHQAGH